MIDPLVGCGDELTWGSTGYDESSFQPSIFLSPSTFGGKSHLHRMQGGKKLGSHVMLSLLSVITNRVALGI